MMNELISALVWGFAHLGAMLDAFGPFLIGVVLALVVAIGARMAGLDLERDRAFYPTVLIVVASYYVLFAAVGGSTRALVAEVVVMLGFIAVAVAGLNRSRWLVAIALAAHGGFDVVHGGLISNAGVPAWWPGFCMGFDVCIGVAMAWLVVREAAARETSSAAAAAPSSWPFASSPTAPPPGRRPLSANR